MAQNRLIHRLRLSNLLSFGPDAGDIELRPLNVLIGPNGSGKSNRPYVENIPKPDLYTALKRATQTSRKGGYGKGRHSFDLLAQLDPQKVVAASPYAKRLVDALLAKS